MAEGKALEKLKEFFDYLLDRITAKHPESTLQNFRGRERAVLRAADRLLRALRGDFYRFALGRELRLAHTWLQVERKASRAEAKRAREREKELLWAASVLAPKVSRRLRGEDRYSLLSNHLDTREVNWKPERIKMRIVRYKRSLREKKLGREYRIWILLNLADEFKTYEFRKRYPNRLPRLQLKGFRLDDARFTLLHDKEIEMLRQLCGRHKD